MQPIHQTNEGEPCSTFPSRGYTDFKPSGFAGYPFLFA